MFKVSQKKEVESKDEFYKNYFRCFAIKFDRDVCENEKDAKKFYKKHYREIGQAINMDKIIDIIKTENQVTLQFGELKKQLDEDKVISVVVMEGVYLLYEFKRFKIAEKDEQQKLQKHFDKVFE